MCRWFPRVLVTFSLYPSEEFRRLIEFSKPIEFSVNNYIDHVSQTFTYKGIDDLVNVMLPADF